MAKNLDCEIKIAFVVQILRSFYILILIFPQILLPLPTYVFWSIKPSFTFHFSTTTKQNQYC